MEGVCGAAEVNANRGHSITCVFRHVAPKLFWPFITMVQYVHIKDIFNSQFLLS